MRTAKQIGQYGEMLAVKYLEKQGYRILSQNYRSNGGEIDIIGFRFGVLVFFEVKTRSNDKFGSPAEAVTPQKIKNIHNAIYDFYATYRRGNCIPIINRFGTERRKIIKKTRIDVIEVYLSDNEKDTRINHIKDWENTL